MGRAAALVFALSLTAGCASLAPIFTTKVDGNRVSYALAGDDSIVVVFEAGLGDGMNTWQPVFEPISSFATTFAYDRPGYGRSDDVSGPSTGKDIVERLRVLLDKLELAPPYILVGHSLGGQVVELYARLYPNEVLGAVLVDSRHTEFTRRCKERLDDSECDIPVLMKLVMPGNMKREFEGAAETADQIRRAPTFPDIELAVLSRSKGKESKEWLAVWAETQEEYATLSGRSKHVVANNSGHYVHKDDPATVIGSVRDLIGRARAVSEQ